MPKQTNDMDSSDSDSDNDQIKTEDDGILLGNSSKGVKLNTHSRYSCLVNLYFKFMVCALIKIILNLE